ncbi:MAG TPA: magnesium transporter [Chromatiales bacterium]|nr:magnesium transporter [Chromatiales bacterium]
MAETTKNKEKAQDVLQLAAEALESGTLRKLQRMVNDLHPAEIAHLLESMPGAQRRIVWELLDPENEGDVLVHLNEEVRTGLIRGMATHELVAATEGLDTDDLADLLQTLPNAVIQEVLRSMDQQNRQRLEQVLSYPEDSAGGLMNTDTITVRADVTLDVVLRYLRLRGELPEATDSLMVVNRFDRYLGVLPLITLLTRDPDLTVAEVMDRKLKGIPATMPAREVANRFERHDLVSAPVVDEQGRLLGRITIDDVVDVIRDETEHSLLSLTGLSGEEDLFSPVLPATRRRAIWLGVNLATAFLASSVVGLFEHTIHQVVALAVLMPIVASMGGIAGTQTLTVVVRGLALDQLRQANVRWLVIKEISVAVANGVLWALVVGVVVVAWFDDLRLAVIIGAAMIINLLCAAIAGVAIPLIEQRMGIDPALAGAVVLTTVTDVMGFFSFLGLATLFLT